MKCKTINLSEVNAEPSFMTLRIGKNFLCRKKNLSKRERKVIKCTLLKLRACVPQKIMFKSEMQQ